MMKKQHPFSLTTRPTTGIKKNSIHSPVLNTNKKNTIETKEYQTNNEPSGKNG